MQTKPSTYTPEFIEKVYEYLDNQRDTPVESRIENKRGKVFTNISLEVNLPSLEDFARYINVSRKSLYNWRDEHPDFADALDDILVEQYMRLINRGLEGTYNSTIAKLILSSNHGLRERVDSTTGDQPTNQFSDEQIDRIADRVAAGKASAGHSPS